MSIAPKNKIINIFKEISDKDFMIYIVAPLLKAISIKYYRIYEHNLITIMLLSMPNIKAELHEDNKNKDNISITYIFKTSSIKKRNIIIRKIRSLFKKDNSELYIKTTTKSITKSVNICSKYYSTVGFIRLLYDSIDAQNAFKMLTSSIFYEIMLNNVMILYEYLNENIIVDKHNSKLLIYNMLINALFNGIYKGYNDACYCSFNEKIHQSLNKVFSYIISAFETKNIINIHIQSYDRSKCSIYPTIYKRHGYKKDYEFVMEKVNYTDKYVEAERIINESFFNNTEHLFDYAIYSMNHLLKYTFLAVHNNVLMSIVNKVFDTNPDNLPNNRFKEMLYMEVKDYMDKHVLNDAQSFIRYINSISESVINENYIGVLYQFGIYTDDVEEYMFNHPKLDLGSKFINNFVNNIVCDKLKEYRYNPNDLNIAYLIPNTFHYNNNCDIVVMNVYKIDRHNRVAIIKYDWASLVIDAFIKYVNKYAITAMEIILNNIVLCKRVYNGLHRPAFVINGVKQENNKSVEKSALIHNILSTLNCVNSELITI